MSEMYTSFLQLLISKHSFHSLERIGKLFPSDLTSFWGYEIPLSSDDQKADLLLCIHKPHRLEEAFNKASPQAASTCLLQPAYDGFGDFANRWAKKDGRLQQLISNIWFEYDFPDSPVSLPVPNFFYAPRQGLHPLAMLHATHLVFQTIFQQTLDKRVYALLLDCVQKLKGNGWISQIGRMMARKEESLRLFVQDIPPQGIIPYLDALNYKPVRRPDLACELQSCYEHCKRVDLDIDISLEVGEKIGLECYFDSTEQALRFLERLRQTNIALAEKSKVLAAHLASIRFDESKEFQPFFSHFKLVYHPDAGFTAKAYTGFVESDLSRRLIRTKPLKLDQHETA